MEATGALARFVAETPASSIPPEARRAAALTVADTFATAIAGSSEPSTQVIRRTLLGWGTGGAATVVGSSSRASAPDAAAINAAAAHALDYDSISFAVSGFIGSAALCAVTALVEESGLDRHPAHEVLTAYILGWEGAAALGRAVNPLHYAKGWHPTATLGGVAATLAAGRLLGLTTEQLRSALAVAVADAGGVKTMIGNMANAWHVAKAARNGLVAAKLAADGFVGHQAALEAPMGFLNVFNGQDRHDAEAIVRTAGITWDLVEPGPIFKLYPCCGLIHSALDAVLDLRARHRIEAADVVEVDILFHEFIPGVMTIDIPDDGYAAKFSVPYCVATTLVDGCCDLRSFTRVRPEVVALGRRVRFGVHPELRGGDTFLENEFSDVEIRCTDVVHRQRVHRMRNRGTGEHLDLEHLRRKFEDCLAFGDWPDDPAREWSRLSTIDGDGPWDPWGATTRLQSGARGR